MPWYPEDTVVCVAATTSSDTLASYSNYGAKAVHIAAPGSSIYSTYLANGYKYLSGTSMATWLSKRVCFCIGLCRTPKMNSKTTSTVFQVTWQVPLDYRRGRAPWKFCCRIRILTFSGGIRVLGSRTLQTREVCWPAGWLAADFADSSDS